MITIYTDGSCIKTKGGWAFCILEEDGSEYYFCGCDSNTTNNKMELTAVIEALECIKINQKCLIYSDSQLTINCAVGKWKRNANLDLWLKYDNISKNKNIKFEWVKAHNGDKYNEIVDKLAYNEAKNQ
jgi:ribonuclease HI